MSGDVMLEPCPFCGDEMMPRHALWPSEGDSDGIIHAHSTECPAEGFSIGTADEGVSVAVAWNRRFSSAAERAVVEALMDATAHLAGSASAYRKYARRHSSVGRSEIDPFFTTRVDDFDKAAERARLALSFVRGEGGDKQARPSGSAPISTDTKGTTK